MNAADRDEYTERMAEIESPDPVEALALRMRLIEEAYEDGRTDGRAESGEVAASFGRGFCAELCERLGADGSSRMLDLRGEES
jgi:hypothetical protein